MTGLPYEVSYFFKDGDIVVGMSKDEFPDYLALLESGCFEFIVSKKEESVQGFLRRMCSCNQLGKNVYIAMRIPGMNNSVQDEIELLIDFKHKNKQKICHWSVIKDIYGDTDIQIGILTDKQVG